MDINELKLIGKGNTADVFDLGDGRVIKLYLPYYPKDAIDTEYKNSCMMNTFPLPIPRSYEKVQVGDRWGIIYDKVSGVTLTERLLESMNLNKYVKIFADLHKQILAEIAPEAYRLTEILRRNIQYTTDLSEKARAHFLLLLDALPDEDSLCHGDYHLGNVLIDGDLVYVIDFYNICRGHRLFDIARTVYLTELTPPPEDCADKAEMQRLKTAVTDAYLSEMGVTRTELHDFLAVTVAARFIELRPEQETERASLRAFLANGDHAIT